MKDLIRSPLQFVRPMSDPEWNDLVSRASHRERQRLKRQQRRLTGTMLDLSRRQRTLGALTLTDAAASV